MRFKPGDRVVITSVPARAAMHGVRAGMKAIILPMPADYDDPSLPLVKLRIGTWDFYWSPNDIEPYLVRPSHPVQLMVGAPFGPDMNGLLYTLREMYKAEDEGNETAWYTSYTTLRAMIETIPK